MVEYHKPITQQISLTALKYLVYRFVLKAKENLFLPPYKGSTLRGGFGTVFRNICCVNKKEENCNLCQLKEKCVYAYIFETSPFKGADRLKKFTEIPRPFVIEPPLETKTFYSKGEEIKFSLILIGRATEYLPYFVFAFRELGNIGIGKRRGRYELSEVFDFCGYKVYDSKDQILKGERSDYNYLSDKPTLTRYLSLSFLTPTRIKFRDDLVVKPEFHVIVRALLHRLSALAYFHCGGELSLDYKELIEQAQTVKIEKSDLRWVDWERYSSRQDTRMKLGGFIGKATYEGEFGPFLPLLQLGQYTHIGKNCTFGLGRYEIIKEN